jgi:beta-lactamase class A
MQRSLFIGGTLAALAYPQPASAATIPLADLIAEIPGTTSVYVRTMDERPPLATIRASEVFSAASTIKLAIMLTAYRAYEGGDATPHTAVRVNPGDLVGGSPSLGYARVGQHYPMAFLIKAMIQQSDNGASNMLISHFGFARINQAIQAAGMRRTKLARHFLDYLAIVKHNDNVTTARDLGSLVHALERGAREGIDTVASVASCRAMIATMLGQEDRTKIPRGVPSGIAVANKTGEIDGVRNDVAIVDPAGEIPYVLVVLTKGLRNEGAGNAGIAAISRRVFAHLHAS